MTTYTKRAVVTVGAQNITITGPRIFETLRPYQIRPIHIVTPPAGWRLDLKRLPDVLAALQRSGYDVRIVDEASDTSEAGE